MPAPRRTLATAVAAALFLTGCGSIGEAVSERALEEGLEAAGGGGDVEIDMDDENGGISIESSEGSMQFGNAEIPEGFPADIPLPEDAVVVSAMSFSDNDAANFNVTMTTAAVSADLAEALEARLVDAGFTIVSTFEQDVEGESMRSLQFEGPRWSGNLVVVGAGDETTVSYTVTPTTE